MQLRISHYPLAQTVMLWIDSTVLVIAKPAKTESSSLALVRSILSNDGALQDKINFENYFSFSSQEWKTAKRSVVKNDRVLQEHIKL